MPGSELSSRAEPGKTRRLWPLMSDPLVCPARTWESMPGLKGLRIVEPALQRSSYSKIRCCETNFPTQSLGPLRQDLSKHVMQRPGDRACDTEIPPSFVTT